MSKNRSRPNQRPNQGRPSQGVPNQNEIDLYEIITRGGGIVIAIALWFISMRFSVDGFQIASEEDMWVGIVLGMTVTYLQIMFNRGAPNKTLYLAGVLAYIYGMSTNLIGIMSIRGNAFTWDFVSTDPLSFALQLTIVFTIAAAVEILPEHLALHSFRPHGNDGDFIDSLFRGMPKSRGDQNRGGSRPRQNRPAPTQNKTNKSIFDGIREPQNQRNVPVNRGDRRGNVTIMNGGENDNRN